MELTNFIDEFLFFLILLLQSLEELFRKGIKESINEISEVLGTLEARVNTFSLLLDNLVVGDEVRNFSFGLVLGVSDCSRIVIEKIYDIVDLFDDDLLSHLERPVRFSWRISRESRVIEVYLGALRFIKVAILLISIDIFISLIKLVLELSLEFILSFKIFDGEELSKTVDIVGDATYLVVQLSDPLLEVIVVLLQMRDEGLRLLGVLVHQISLGLQTVSFKLIDSFSQSW
jgi:hypothetical protein